MAPAKKGGEKGRSAITEVATRGHTIYMHKCTQGVGFKARPSGTQGDLESRPEGNGDCGRTPGSIKLLGRRRKGCSMSYLGSFVQNTK